MCFMKSLFLIIHGSMHKHSQERRCIEVFHKLLRALKPPHALVIKYVFHSSTIFICVFPVQPDRQDDSSAITVVLLHCITCILNLKTVHLRLNFNLQIFFDQNQQL